MVLCLRIAFCVLLLFHYEIIMVARGEEIIQILREKVTGLEDSLSMDIKLLRADMKKNSDEFQRLSNLLDNTLAALDGEPELNGDANKELESQIKQSDITQGFELANRRLKRAFAEEKAVLRKVTSRMKSEIDHLAKEIGGALGEFKISHVKANNELEETFESFKTDLTQGLNQAMTDLGSSLTNSVEAMSHDVTKDTKKTVSTVENMSENIGMVSDIKDTVDDTSTRIKYLSNKIDTKFNDINVILNQLKTNTHIILQDKIVGNGEVRLANVSRRANTIAGRQEVFANNAWGTVCDDNFDIKDANIACKTLGFSTAHSFKYGAFYGSGDGPIWLDELSCWGRESSLLECAHAGVGKHDCGHSEDAGVRCHY